MTAAKTKYCVPGRIGEDPHLKQNLAYPWHAMNDTARAQAPAAILETKAKQTTKP